VIRYLPRYPWPNGVPSSPAYPIPGFFPGYPGNNPSSWYPYGPNGFPATPGWPVGVNPRFANPFGNGVPPWAQVPPQQWQNGYSNIWNRPFGMSRDAYDMDNDFADSYDGSTNASPTPSARMPSSNVGGSN
jgi:hypothetical protein